MDAARCAGFTRVIAAPATLPRLLYVGDVTVADTTAGEALLFRLLQSYPPEKLALICAVRAGAPLLPGAAYHHWGAAFPRLLRSRIAEEYALYRAWKCYRVPRTIAAVAAQFKPDAILTISHVSAWLCGWQLAAGRRLPLHIIVHDDLVYANRFPTWARAWAERHFGEAYRAAKSRLCISEPMVDAYQRRFGITGTVIHPSRGALSVMTSIAPRVRHHSRPLTFAYGGSINSPRQFDQLRSFATVAAAAGHRTIVFTPQHASLRAAAAASTVGDVRTGPDDFDLRGAVSPPEFMRIVREDADCLLLPQPFDESDRAVASTSFPSKWVEYSAVGLPLLVWAPPWSTSAQFAMRHERCAEVVTSPDPGDLASAIGRLAESVAHRTELAERVLALGRDAFSPETAWRTFWTALQS